MTYDLTMLTEDLIRDEGLRLKPYKDTAGKTTIGVGRNLDGKGITKEEAHYLLGNDIAEVSADFDRLIPWWRELSEARQRALVNMGFMGTHKILEFRRMLIALQAGDFVSAAKEALLSQWATQVGDRAERVAKLIEEG